ncbi:protein SPT2 homolog [Tiliqua scincoides]|uniref:protein SPT2 homolog n=1 Tax=Tiliqua scincoides TaxID=71010 RepID=UPI003463040C
MDFRDILVVASEQQGFSAVPKRYSLAVGPPKKDPKVKGVHSAAVQAFLKRQEDERKKKVLEEKRRKEDLLAKRVELKHDRKARAMASRTKDNFRGYNGIPVEEKPRKRQGRENNSDRILDRGECMTGDEMEQFEYSQSESEHESDAYEEKPATASVKPKVLPKSAPPPMNFTDLLKLAEKKQYEPVEIKVVKKTEERPMTAEELREREYLERKNRKGGLQKEKKVEKEVKGVASNSSKKEFSQKEFINAKLSKQSTDKHSISKGNISSQSGIDKKSKGPALSEKPAKLLSSSKPNHTEKAKLAHKGPLKNPPSSSHAKLPSSGGKSASGSHIPVLKTAVNGSQKYPHTKEPSLKKTASHTKPTNMSAGQHESVRNSSFRQGNSSSSTGEPNPRPKSSLSTGPGRPGSSLSTGHRSQGTSSGMVTGRSGSSSGLGQRSSNSSMGPGRPGSMAASKLGPARVGSSQSTGPGRPGSSMNTGLGKGSNSGSGPGRPSSTSVGTLKPKCTVVSETISSKNLVPRQISGQMNGKRPFPPQRSGIPPQAFPRPFLPPITSKRQYEDDEEYDSEMEDFIDDEGEPQEVISQHIKEIFGYDRNRYKDESDYALRYMESSWKEQQKEEAKSLRLGMQEDLEELRREEMELKRKRQAKKLRTR